ncbi:hypothetical protein [Lewinella sp. JB7]|uniref:hypothetical protein n=1 Tax=Lewinella sp. JB7 TaxID=2962887 RepID=UPI0020C9BA1A|nr:hypothetical protein [Lewinella sp. JB7]MCP9237202.1 hypothetical protein [Lewinella sp. JB7]
MSSHDSFERQFRRTARNMRRRPSPANWDRIEARLDGRGAGPRLLGVRPWMIAAILLLFAGYAAVNMLNPEPAGDPLAQRAQTVEELDAEVIVRGTRLPDYQPLTEGRANASLVSPTEQRSRLMVAPKYRL